MAQNLNSQETSSKRHFNWTTKVSNIVEEKSEESSQVSKSCDEKEKKKINDELTATHSRRKKLPAVAVTRRLQSVLSSLGRNRASLFRQRLLLGTLFGTKRGHVHLVLQKDAKSQPTLLMELATPITGLVREIGSGSVRITLECDKKKVRNSTNTHILEEPLWRTYCNCNRFGYASRLECGEKEWKILKAVEPISMGAGVLPEKEGEEEVIYMRAKFERVVGTKDSEAFYMINPDNNATTELSIYFLRV